MTERTRRRLLDKDGYRLFKHGDYFAIIDNRLGAVVAGVNSLGYPCLSLEEAISWARDNAAPTVSCEPTEGVLL